MLQKSLPYNYKKREYTKPPHYEELQAKFDQMRPVIASNTTQAIETTTIPPSYQLDPHNDTPHTPTVAILVHSSNKPVAYKNIMDCFRPQNPPSAQWQYTAFQ